MNLPLESDWRQFVRFVAHLGDGPYVFGGLGLSYVLGWLGGEARFCRNIFTTALIVLLAILLVTWLKFTVRRKRPQPPGEFVIFTYDVYSFPSGHATRLAALAVCVVLFYPALGWVLAIVALSVAGARVAVGIHYLSDIVVGLSVGALVAWGSFLFFNNAVPF